MNYFIVSYLDDYVHSIITTMSISLAFLNVGDYNIILIDWRDAANHSYLMSVRSVPLVSQRVAFLINFLENNANLDPNKTVIIGHSLGAHIASLSARFATSKIAEVIGKSATRFQFYLVILILN